MLKYNGGGDWYANLETSLPNLIKFCNETLKTSINSEQAIVDVGSVELFNYPLVHMTGHGNVIFSNQEAENLRNYLIAGGFFTCGDNYGMDKFIRPQLKKVFPELDLVELPSIIQSIIKNSISTPAYQKFTNTTTVLQKDSV